jgi:hypothetical protein
MVNRAGRAVAAKASRLRELQAPWFLPVVLAVASSACSEGPSPDIEPGMPPTDAPVSAVDLAAIELFWQVVDTLSSDLEPSPALWTALFDTPGYRALTRSEFDPGFFRRNFRLAYKPSLRDSLTIAGEELRAGRFLRHYEQVGQRRVELESFAAELASDTAFGSPSRLAAKWLPPPAPSDPAPVALVVFSLDARGYDPIVMDVLAARELDLRAFVAHESHHWYRNRRATIDWDQVPQHEQDLLWTLYQIQGEGIADQIDKRAWIEGKEPIPAGREAYAEAYLEALEAAPGTIRALDSLLVAFSAAPMDEQRAAIGAHVAEIVPMSGHPTGYHVARAILETEGRERLVADIANPAAFLLSYDEASRSAGGGGLSPGAVKYLAELAERFRR